MSSDVVIWFHIKELDTVLILQPRNCYLVLSNTVIVDESESEEGAVPFILAME